MMRVVDLLCGPGAARRDDLDHMDLRVKLAVLTVPGGTTGRGNAA